MWKCKDCGSIFESFLVRHDSIQTGEDEYEDAYVCPFCDSEELEPVEEEERT